jgi:hypothetical protein
VIGILTDAAQSCADSRSDGWDLMEGRDGEVGDEPGIQDGRFEIQGVR